MTILLILLIPVLFIFVYCCLSLIFFTSLHLHTSILHFIPLNRPREPPVLVNAIPRPTPFANVAVPVPTTSKRRPVPNAVTPLPSSVPSTGASREREERPPELVVCAISKICHVVSRTVSVRELALNPAPLPLLLKLFIISLGLVNV
jgi:hypothetical protein